MTFWFSISPRLATLTASCLWLLIGLQQATVCHTFTVPPSSIYSSLPHTTSAAVNVLTNRPTHRQSTVIVSMSQNDRNDEIAQLEEQLRKLKQEQESQPEQPPDEEEKAPKTARDPALALSSLQTQDKLFVDRQVLLSEQELANANLLLESDNDQSGGGGGIVNIVVGILALVGLIAFSQVPVGQENLARYSATGTASSSLMKQVDLGDLNTDVRRSD